MPRWLASGAGASRPAGRRTGTRPGPATRRSVTRTATRGPSSHGPVGRRSAARPRPHAPGGGWEIRRRGTSGAAHRCGDIPGRTHTHRCSVWPGHSTNCPAMRSLHTVAAEIAQQRDGISIRRPPQHGKREYVPAPPGRVKPAEQHPAVFFRSVVKASSPPGEKRREVSRRNIESVIDRTRRGWQHGLGSWFDPAPDGELRRQVPGSREPRTTACRTIRSAAGSHGSSGQPIATKGSAR